MVQKIRKDTHGHTATTPPHGLPTAVMPVRRHRQNRYIVYQTTRSCKRLLNMRPGLVVDVYRPVSVRNMSPKRKHAHSMTPTSAGKGSSGRTRRDRRVPRWSLTFNKHRHLVVGAGVPIKIDAFHLCGVCISLTITLVDV